MCSKIASALLVVSATTISTGGTVRFASVHVPAVLTYDRT